MSARCQWPLSESGIHTFGRKDCGLPEAHIVHQPRATQTSVWKAGEFSNTDSCHPFRAEEKP